MPAIKMFRGHGPLLHKPVQDEQLTEICRAHSGGDAA